MYKQVIVIRRDLKMRRGKEVAQGSHASMQFLLDAIEVSNKKRFLWFFRVPVKFTKVEKEWFKGFFTKVCVRVDSEEELLSIHEKAKESGLKSYLITDAGKTEFHGKPTPTCLAIGPDEAEKLNKVTGHLELM